MHQGLETTTEISWAQYNGIPNIVECLKVTQLLLPNISTFSKYLQYPLFSQNMNDIFYGVQWLALSPHSKKAVAWTSNLVWGLSV